MDPPLQTLNSPPPSILHDQASEQLTGIHGMATSQLYIPSPPAASHPKRRKLSGENELRTEDLSSDDVLGQFSFGPTTQTTVVTTTTTTTTSFPPLKIKAPNLLRELDPKVYPLASAPTPQSMKKLCFDVGGRATVFQEADDTMDTYREVLRFMF